MTRSSVASLSMADDTSRATPAFTRPGIFMWHLRFDNHLVGAILGPGISLPTAACLPMLW